MSSNTTIVVLLFLLSIKSSLGIIENPSISKFSVGTNELTQEEKRILMLKSLIVAYNTDDEETIRSFIKENFSQGYKGIFNKNLQYRTNYLRKLYREIGPLEYVTITEIKQAKFSQIWMRGTFTKNYYGFLFHTDKQEKLAAFNLMRGVVPPWFKKKQFQELDFNQLDNYLNSLSEADLFSGSVLIGHQDQILFNKGHLMRCCEVAGSHSI